MGALSSIIAYSLGNLFLGILLTFIGIALMFVSVPIVRPFPSNVTLIEPAFALPSYVQLVLPTASANSRLAATISKLQSTNGQTTSLKPLNSPRKTAR